MKRDKNMVLNRKKKPRDFHDLHLHVPLELFEKVRDRSATVRQTVTEAVVEGLILYLQKKEPTER